MSIYTLDQKLTGLLYIDAVHTNTHKDDTVMWDFSRGGERETEVARSDLEVEKSPPFSLVSGAFWRKLEVERYRTVRANKTVLCTIW